MSSYSRLSSDGEEHDVLPPTSSSAHLRKLLRIRSILSFRNKLLMLVLSVMCFIILVYLKTEESVFERSDTSETLQQQHTSNLCTPTTFNVGSFVRTPLPFVDSKSALLREAGSWYRCMPKSKGMDVFVRSKKAMEWSWKPESCTLLEFNPKAFTRHLKNNSILFFGDSISLQQYNSLRCMLNEFLFQIKDPYSPSMAHNTRSVIWRSQLQSRESKGLNKTLVMYIRSDSLVRSRDLSIVKPGEDQELERDPHNFAWSHYIPGYKYIVLNTGAHWNKNFNTKLPILEAYQVMIDRVLNFFVTEHPHARVFIRGSVYGHYNCSQYTEPLKVPVIPTRSAEQYNWLDFLEMNKMWKSSIRTLNNPQISYFDVSFTELRGDGHTNPKKSDCLHYLLPGPMDEWNKLLYHEIFKDLKE